MRMFETKTNLKLNNRMSDNFHVVSHAAVQASEAPYILNVVVDVIYPSRNKATSQRASQKAKS